MIIYSTAPNAHLHAAQKIYVKPGQNPESDPVDWYEDEAKKKAIQFQVIFVHGKADVIDTLGKYLVAQGVAKKSRLALPI
jgi:hypothetical protein